MSVVESVMQGLSEAMDFARGKEVGARVRQIEIPPIDVAVIRVGDRGRHK